MSFADKLQSERRKNGLTQEDLAEAMGVSRQAVSKWEQGEGWPEAEKLLALADRFGVSLDYLMDRAPLEKSHVDASADAPAAGVPADEASPETVSFVPMQSDDPLNFDGDPERETPEAKHNRLLLAIALVCIAAVVLLFLSGLK